MDRAFELELLARMRTGDEAAFDRLHAEFNTRLFGFLMRLSRRRDVAEELLEETWLRFVRHADRLELETQIGAWLFTVARNLHVSYCRNRVLELNATAGLSVWPRPVDTPFEISARTEFEARLEAALADLPLTLREALLLVGVEEMRPSEAAVVCGVTAEAMRQRVHRARTLLAQRLGYSVSDLRRRTGA